MAYVFPTFTTDSVSTREPVIAATTTAGTLSTDFENGDTIDGVTLATGNRILIKDQADASENGVYEVQASGAPIRVADFYDGQSAGGISFTILEGTVNDDTMWLCSTDPPTDIIGTDDLNFIKSAGLGANGDVTGPVSSTTNTIPRFADTGGKTLTTTGLVIDNSDNLSGVASLILEAGANDLTISAATQTTGPSTVTIPDLGGTGGDLTVTNAVQTLTNKTLTSPTLTDPVLTDPQINDTSADHQYIIGVSELAADRTITLPLLGAADTFVFEAHTQTMTNKTLTLPVIAQISNSGTLTLPSGTTDTLVARATADTLTNKTMNASNNTFTNFLHGTQVDNPSSGVHGVTGTIVGTSDTQTLTNKTVTSPIINQITTDGTEEVLIFADAGTAVNEFTMTNAATGTDPMLSATGGDTNIGIALETKGSGTVSIGSASATDSGILELFDDTGGESASLTVPTAITTAYTLTLPDGVGSNGQFLRTDGNNPATLTWAAPAGGGDVNGPGSSTDNALVRWDGASGTAVLNSGVILSDTDSLSGLVNVGLSGDILDANSNELIDFTAIGSAVNQLAITNAATATNPVLSATGGDTNIGLDFQTKGTGAFNFLATTSGPTDIRWYEDADNGTEYVSIIAPATLAGNQVLTLPDATDTLVARATTDTLTNKTITGSTNTVSADFLKTTGADVDVVSAAPPTTGQVLTATGATTATWQAASGGGSADYKDPVRVATAVAGTLATSFENGDTVDGIVLATNDRILIKNQASGIENGIYTVNASGAPTRATDLAATDSAASATVYVQEGTANSESFWVCTNLEGSDVVGTDALVFERFARTAPEQYDAVVATDGTADYLLPSAAFTAGAQTVFVRDGAYTETVDVVVPGGGALIGESIDGVAITMSGSVSIKCDGNSGTKETAGSISITNGTTAVTGSGTTFTNITATANTFIIIEHNAYPVTSITDATNLTIGITFNGTTVSGGPYILQDMHTSLIMQNFTVIGSTTANVMVRAIRHSVFENVISRSASPNFDIEDCVNNVFSACMSQNATGMGYDILDTFTCTFSDCQSFNSGTHGMNIAGISQNIVVDGSQFANSDNTGLNITGTSTLIQITGCILNNNNNLGVNTDAGTGTAIISGCTMRMNASHGIDFDGTEDIVDGCVITDNGGHGVQAGVGGTISANHIQGNATDGVSLNGDTDCLITGNHITNNNVGINVLSNSHRNSITGNYIATSTTHGIALASGNDNVISANVIYNNTTNGINAVSPVVRTTISGNKVLANTVGISIASGCVDTNITGNSVSGNSSHGISTTANTNLLSSNRVTGNTGDGIRIETGATDVTYLSNNTQGNTGTDFVDNGTITSLEGILINSVDSRSATTLLLGSATATKVELADTGVTTETQGPLTALEGVTVTGNIGLSGDILDVNSNELIDFTATGSAVNQLAITNAATATNPQLSATGGDTNIGLDFQVKGTGTYRFLGTATSHAEVRLFEDTDNGTNYTAWAAPAAVGTTTTLRMPDGVGTNGQFLQTDGSNPATLVWASAGGGDTVDTVTTTTNAVTTISTIATSSDTTYFVEAKVTARRTDAGSESAGYKLYATYRNNGGTLTQVASDDLMSQEDSAQWSVSTAISGTNILIRVTGQNSKTINWKSSYNTIDV